MINHVSNSMLGLWYKCEVAWEFRYTPPYLRIPPQVAAHRGSALHYAAEINFKEKIITGKDQPEDVLTDACRDKFIQKCKDGVSIPKEDRSRKNDLLNNELNQAIEHTKIYHKAIAPKIIPAIVEKEIWGDFGLDFLLMGIIDVGDNKKCIHDFKSVSKRKAKGWEYSELQPSFCTLLYNNYYGEKAQFKYHLIKDNDDERDSTRNENDCAKLLQRVENFIARIKTGIFRPAEPGHWLCSEKWCGYWPICKYAS